MSAAYYIVLDNDDPGFDTLVNGKAVAAHADIVSKLAQDTSLRTLDDLTSFSAGELEDMQDEFGIDPAETPPERWFTAEEGLQWVRGLRAALESAVDELPAARAVVEDLDEFEQVLEQAGKIGACWHLSVDY